MEREINSKILVKSMWEAFNKEVCIYNKIWDYYKGKTDAKSNYTQTRRSNLKVGCNYLKKFVKEETSYSVGNSIAFNSKTENQKAIDTIIAISENFNENHDINNFLHMVLFGLSYEIYYIDRWGDLQVRTVRPNQGYAIEGDDGTVKYFTHFYSEKELVGNVIKEVTYADLYTETYIQTFKREDNSFVEVGDITEHYFGECPVGMAKISDLTWEDTIYNDIKELQDALETNFSDIVNEISDFRNAYLVLTGMTLEEEDEKSIGDSGILEIPTAEGKAEWLIKNVNDTFIQNTLKALQEKLYEISSHINNNDSEQMSNASGVALKSRLINLMQRCKVNENSYTELLKTRIRIIFVWANQKSLGAYDWKDIKVKYSPLIPSDDTVNADIITKLQGIVSDSTLLSLLSFVENPAEEIEKVEAQNDSLKGYADPQSGFIEEEEGIEGDE